MVAASTSFGYSSVNQFDGTRSIMWRQPSSCSSCSGSSNCGRYNVQQEHRERTCTRCQSLHRHHLHRQRRRSSGAQLRSSLSSNTTPSGGSLSFTSTTTKALVTINPPQSCTIALDSTPSGTTTSLVKHCTFAPNPITIPPPPNQSSTNYRSLRSKNQSFSVSSQMIASTPSTTLMIPSLTRLPSPQLSPSSTLSQQSFEMQPTSHQLINGSHEPDEGVDEDDVDLFFSTSTSASEQVDVWILNENL